MNILGSLQDYLKPKKMLATFPGSESSEQPGGAEPDVNADDFTLNPRAPAAPKALMSGGSWDNYLQKKKLGGQ